MSKALDPIQRWSPRHEMVVQLSIGPMTMEEISKATGYSKVRVTQILADPQARRIQDAVIERMRARMMEDIEGKLFVLSSEAVERLFETISYKEFVLGSDAKKHQDNLSMTLLKGTGFLSGVSSNGSGIEQEPALTERLSERLVTALEESNKAEELRKKGEEIVATDADHVTVESTG